MKLPPRSRWSSGEVPSNLKLCRVQLPHDAVSAILCGLDVAALCTSTACRALRQLVAAEATVRSKRAGLTTCSGETWLQLAHFVQLGTAVL